jgi:hypothetical protein
MARASSTKIAKIVPAAAPAPAAPPAEPADAAAPPARKVRRHRSTVRAARDIRRLQRTGACLVRPAHIGAVLARLSAEIAAEFGLGGPKGRAGGIRFRAGARRHIRHWLEHETRRALRAAAMVCRASKCSQLTGDHFDLAVAVLDENDDSVPK